MIPVIAIDGPAGSGKGTMARKLASHFGFAYLDTGLLYRTIAYLGLSCEKLAKLSIEELLAASQKISEADLRSDEVSIKTSQLSQKSEVREILNRLEREFAAHPKTNCKGIVLDGRDIGTVVFPDAPCKLFITADLKIRAQRRWDTIKRTNCHTTFQEVCRNLELRDKQDSSRAVAPLKFNDSYTLIDTSAETVQESFLRTVKIVEEIFAAANIKV